MPYNQQQLLAINHRGTPLMIEAGAGTGKTTTIIGRVVSILEEGIPPNQICMMTFTNKAAKSMQKKIIAKTPRGKQITVGTFHGIALQLLFKASALVGQPANYKVFGTYETEKLWKRAISLTLSDEQYEIISNNKLHKPAIYDSLYSRMKSGLMDIAQLYKVLPKAQLVNMYLGEGTLERIFSEYEAQKRANKGVDFNDILEEFYTLLDNKSALAYVRRRFSYYFIDEYQDTSKIQAAILHKMLGDNPNVTVVGDPNQSIYSFLSANIHNMLDFTQEYPGATVIKLNENYRSTDAILGVTNQILQNKETVHNPLHSGRIQQTLKQPVFHNYTNEREEAAAIVRSVKYWISKGIPANEIAVLSRFSRTTGAVEQELLQNAIPFAKYGGVAFQDKFHVRKFIALMELAMDKRNYLAWEEILPLAPYIGEELTTRVISEMQTDTLWNWQLLPCTGLGNGKRGQALRQLWDMLSDFQALENAAISAQDFLHLVRGVFEKVYTWYVQNLGQLKQSKDAKIGDDEEESQGKSTEEILQEHLKEIQGFVEYLLSSRTGDLKAILGAFRLDSSGMETQDDDKVVVSTIHSAKGLEWENVFIIGLEDGLLPPIPRNYGQGKYKATENPYTEEEERLFYVAATRAKNELHMTLCNYRMGFPQTPSPFIRKFFDADITKLLSDTKKYEKLNFNTHRLFIKI